MTSGTGVERPVNVRFVPCVDFDHAYSITSSARNNIEVGTVRPSALAA
jgi:hypothetical protein